MDRGVEQREDALRRRHRALQDVELLGQVADRPEEALRILQECHQRTERERVLDDEAAADPDHQRRRQGADQLDRRVEHGVIEDRLDVGVAVPAIDLVEGLEVARLTAVQLHGAHAGDALLQEGVDAGDPGADAAIGLAHVAAEPLRDQQHQRQHRERRERQPPVHPHQHHHDAGQREHVAEHRDDARGEELVEHVDVRRHARHQPAHRVPIVELQVEPLQVADDLHPQVEHDPLPGRLHRPRLQELEAERHHEDGEVERGKARESGDVAGRDVAVDDQLGQIGRRELQRRMRDDGGNRQRDVAAVRPEVSHQPPHQPSVVRLAEGLLLVSRHGTCHQLAASSSSSSCFR
jgi:hypothetical protein